ncbi:VOC family protein [Shewanella sp. AS16]|uniref:VOC family protein n=1 Tax=Shewanella sp. AS16 TaxID=2907625 RepID=UPI001F2EABF3|nr:VOC family protein [Shewanella sp. AS16]MCE9684704.1 VOC family protein [Shewanella sp. AS16]
MISILDLDHIVLNCRDLAASEAFYCQVLGCRVERRLAEPVLVQLRAGAALIDLTYAEPGEDKPRVSTGNMAHFCLNLAQTDGRALLAHLRQHGVRHESLSEKYGARGYSQSVYIYDPDDNKVELKLLAPRHSDDQES